MITSNDEQLNPDTKLGKWDKLAIEILDKNPDFNGHNTLCYIEMLNHLKISTLTDFKIGLMKGNIPNQHTFTTSINRVRQIFPEKYELEPEIKERNKAIQKEWVEKWRQIR